MFSGEFYKNRKKQIDERLNFIENVWTQEEISTFVSNIQCNHTLELQVLIPYKFKNNDLNDIIQCIGKQVLADVCRRFVHNFRLFRAGLPDLFLWNPTEKKVLEYKIDNFKIHFLYFVLYFSAVLLK